MYSVSLSAGSRALKFTIASKAVSSSSLGVVVVMFVLSLKLKMISISVFTSVLSIITEQMRANVVPRYRVPFLLGTKVTEVAGGTRSKLKSTHHGKYSTQTFNFNSLAMITLVVSFI